MKRKPPTMKEKLAAALLTLVRPDENGNLVRIIAHQEAKTLSPEAIIARFELDHDVWVAIGGTNHPSNLTWRPKAEHRAKTAKVDIPAIAKGKRIRAKYNTDALPSPSPRRKQKAVMPGSRASKYKRHLSGKVSLRA